MEKYEERRRLHNMAMRTLQDTYCTMFQSCAPMNEEYWTARFIGAHELMLDLFGCDWQDALIAEYFRLLHDLRFFPESVQPNHNLDSITDLIVDAYGLDKGQIDSINGKEE